MNESEKMIACRERVSELYAEGTMWAEARGQWLASCLECEDENGWQYADCELDQLERRAYFWAQNLYSDCGYDWLAQAMEEADQAGWPM